MKKFLAMLLCAAMLLCLAACNGDDSGPDTTEPSTGHEDVFSFQVEGAVITPGTAFDPSKIPGEPKRSTIPSCAFEGTDNVYTYELFEVIAYNEGDGEVVYSVYFLDANVTTPEGLAIGDDASKATTLYGEGKVNGTEVTYQKGNTLLVLILENDFVASIEYREAV